MNKLFKNRRVLLAAAAVFLFFACETTLNIAEDLSPAELIQRAQEASDRNSYNTALQYYQALRDRNYNIIDLVITAEYEIAFIHYKQRKFEQAREELNAVLRYYNTYNASDEQLLPQHFKRLAQIVLKSIDEKESRGPFSR